MELLKGLATGLIFSAIVIGLASCSNGNGTPNPQPTTLGWTDGAYVATVHGHDLPFHVAGESVGVGSVDLQSSWQRPSFSYQWWYVGGRDTADGPFQLALYPSIRSAKVYVRGQWHDAKVSFLKGNG